ncbi:cap-specific mRNA (nucleoside-2'-O-)-methyltransferase 1-like [Toxorhynchites rutilus septentrionalis]|uniref:cap-specific mRNA (nucleoside-2'-O-)-methyltransferase 1-like n=1 Tax=Toxorhynchites rutilus septentrionalis TaxID=329112 RepID=UPI00247AEDD9|nr:cap-specific mRNA (nucleoside-2'-O-)-methyltransferase 1-like [Toxorhynchites rutilus septentrionalis]
MMDSPDIIQARIASQEANLRQLGFNRNAPEVLVDVEEWLQIGLRKDTIDDEIHFCDAARLAEVLQLKSSLTDVDQRAVANARRCSNPFEFRTNQFVSRAAVKIANLDAIFDWKLCQLEDERDLMYFADVFGGPGGCSEYVLWRNATRFARGFGFSTKGDYEFRPELFRAGCPELLDPYYGPNDDGNIFDPGNIRGFIDYVLAQTENLGVHLLVCDGGFFIKNNNQEVISKQLYLCLSLLAVSVVRPKGNAIVKVFDLYTPFSAGLVYILSKSYGKISIVKPVSSRPANSERYLICEDRLNQEPVFGEYLFLVNEVLWENKHLQYDILEIVSMDTMKQDVDFYNFIRNSNNDLVCRQIEALKSLIERIGKPYKHAAVADRELMQSTLWRLWKLDHSSQLSPISPDDVKKSATEYAQHVLDATTVNTFTKKEALLCDRKSLVKTFGDPNDWSFLSVDVTADQDKMIRTVFLSKGNGNVFYFDRVGKEWRQVTEYCLVLLPKTVLYGEIVEEISVMDKKHKIMLALHIIDAIVLGGQNIGSYSLKKRNALCAKFAEALNRPLAHRSAAADVCPIPIRYKQMYPMTDLDGFFDDISINELSGSGTKVLGCEVESVDSRESTRFYIPRGLLFMRHSLAKNQGVKKKLDFDKCFASRQLWVWTQSSQIYSTTQCLRMARESGLVYRKDIDKFVEKFARNHVK